MRKLMVVVIGLSMFLALSAEGMCESFWTDYYSATEEYVRLNNLEMEGIRISEKLSTSKELWDAYDGWGYLKQRVKKLKFSDKDIEIVGKNRFTYAKILAEGFNWDDKEVVKEIAEIWGTPENKKGFIEKVTSNEMQGVADKLRECVEYLENAVKLRKERNKSARSGGVSGGVSYTRRDLVADMYFVASLLKAKEISKNFGEYLLDDRNRFMIRVGGNIKYFLIEKRMSIVED